MGWDNFSSYLNPLQNFFNTFFATWREHRGIGVPSDAENADLIRQVFNAVLSIPFGIRVADQLYMISMLWGGVIGMYFLGLYVANRLKFHHIYQELFGFAAAFLYLFNLSTLAVFYFPMIMYNTRFFMLPTTTLALLYTLQHHTLSARQFIAIALAFTVGMGSFMVPTIFIVYMMGLVAYLLFSHTPKRTIVVIATFVFLNSFWLLPFVNYTVQKSAVVPQAPTFIEINESMLNKPKSFYSFERQAKLRPSFFESEFTNIAQKNKATAFHPLATVDENGITRILLWIFPLLYIAGILINILFTRNKLIGWFGFLTLSFLILSMKEYSPFGPLYNAIAENIPFANTIFRFGDTKFHAMIAFGGSISGAFAVVTILRWFEKIKPLQTVFGISMIFVLFASATPFATYFNGNLIGFFMYNKLPDAYWNISKTINEDKSDGRVIQLPFDTHTYWKPYSWGYFGSSFLHFMLNKPLIDRTFEPASLEGSTIHNHIIELYSQSSSVGSQDGLREKALDLHRLLTSLSVTFIIDDQTISSNIDARNIAYWGTISPTDSHKLIEYMNSIGLVTLIEEYEVDPMQFSKEYGTLYPYNAKSTYAYPPRQIYLYRVNNSEPRISFTTEADRVNSAYTNRLAPRYMRFVDNHYVQDGAFDRNALLFPFQQNPSDSVDILQNQVTIQTKVPISEGNYNLKPFGDTPVQQQLVAVYARTRKDEVEISITDPQLPQLGEGVAQIPLTYITTIIPSKNTNYHYLSINETVLPLVFDEQETFQYIGSVFISDSNIALQLLYKQFEHNVSTQLKNEIDNVQCLNDQLDNPKSHINGENGILRISGQNVSTCFTQLTNLELDKSNEPVFVDLQWETEGTVVDITPDKPIDSSKNNLHSIMRSLTNPLTLTTCIRPTDSESCVNKTQLFRIENEKTRHNVSVFGDFSNINDLVTTFVVRNAQRQEYDLSISNIILTTYSGSEIQTIIVPIERISYQQYLFTHPTTLTVTSPVPDTIYSQFINLANDAVLIGRDQTCDNVNKYQTMKSTPKGMLSYLVGCKNFVNRNIPFNSSHFYLWDVTYKHFSGAMPAFIIMDTYETYSYNKLYPQNIPVNDYFSIPLQRPEFTFLKNSSFEMVSEKTKPYSIHGFLYPEPELENATNKEIIIEHFSQNEGLVELQQISLVNLPEQWAQTVLMRDDYDTVKYEEPRELTYKRILPSIARIQFNSPGGIHLLHFSEQFDMQWMLIGAKSNHLKCDGSVNCYEVTVDEGNHTVYLFYLPELLSILGYLTTALLFVFAYRQLVKSRKSVASG